MKINPRLNDVVGQAIGTAAHHEARMRAIVDSGAAINSSFSPAFLKILIVYPFEKQIPALLGWFSPAHIPESLRTKYIIQ